MLTIKQIFNKAQDMAIDTDPRGLAGVEKHLSRIKKAFNGMKEEDRKYFDQDNLVNPYSDSKIHLGDDKKPVKRVLAGIDIGSAEILLASQMNERDKPIDLIISHHPVGKSLANLHNVMDMAIDIYENCGVPVHVAEKMTEERVLEVGRSVHPVNHYQIIDLARILGVDLINTHTMTDNLVSSFLEKYLTKKNPDTVGEMIKDLLEIPEYQEGKHRGFGPKIFAGNKGHRVGKFMIEMTGGTNPSKKVYQELSRAGISTIVGMHMKDDASNKARDSHMNVLIAGHISSDSLGMNLFLDELEKKGVEVVPCGGLIRVSRVEK